MKQRVNKLVILGDSLSDAGAMNNTRGMRVMSGVYKTKEKKFTNGAVWTDYLLGKWGSRSNTADDSFHVNLGHHKKKLVGGEKVNRSYAIGGATSHSTSHGKGVAGVARKAVSHLENERKALYKDDIKFGVSKEEKASTLVAEWSGGNDIVTVSHGLINGDMDEARKQKDFSIQARLENIESMLQQGYKNFALVTLPNLANTPRFNTKKVSDEQRAQVSAFCDEFNQDLQKGIDDLIKKYGAENCNVKLFDVNKTFNKLYNNPTEYGFDSDTTKQAKNQTSAEGNNPLFFDDVHPSTQAHELIANEFQEFCENNFEVNIGLESKLQNKSADDLVKMFEQAHSEELQRSKAGRWSSFRKSDIQEAIQSAGNNPDDKLQAIFEYALKKGNDCRSYKILKRLDMLTAKGPEALVNAREEAYSKFHNKEKIQRRASHVEETINESIQTYGKKLDENMNKYQELESLIDQMLNSGARGQANIKTYKEVKNLYSQLEVLHNSLAKVDKNYDSTPFMKIQRTMDQFKRLGMDKVVSDFDNALQQRVEKIAKLEGYVKENNSPNAKEENKIIQEFMKNPSRENLKAVLKEDGLQDVHSDAINLVFHNDIALQKSNSIDSKMKEVMSSSGNRMQQGAGQKIESAASNNSTQDYKSLLRNQFQKTEMPTPKQEEASSMSLYMRAA